MASLISLSFGSSVVSHSCICLGRFLVLYLIFAFALFSCLSHHFKHQVTELFWSNISVCRSLTSFWTAVKWKALSAMESNGSKHMPFNWYKGSKRGVCVCGTRGMLGVCIMKRTELWCLGVYAVCVCVWTCCGTEWLSVLLRQWCFYMHECSEQTAFFSLCKGLWVSVHVS